MFLDENNDLRNPKEIYHIEGILYNFLVDNHFNEKYYKLKLPSDNLQNKSYLDFCSYHGVNIINSDKIQFFNTEKEEVIELREKLNRFILFYSSNKKSNFTPQEYSKLYGIKFYSTKEIKISYQGNIMSKNVISYYLSNKNIEIYFIKDDVYNTWKHSTILYFIAKWISISVFEDNRIERLGKQK